MLPRLAILIAFFSFLSDASAQFYNPGMMMGQQCPYPFQQAPQILPPGLQQRELEREARREAREMAAEIGEQIREKLREIDVAKRPLYRRLRPGPATVVFRHLEDRGDGYGLVDCPDGAVLPRRARPLVPSYDANGPCTVAPPTRSRVDEVLPPQPAAPEPTTPGPIEREKTIKIIDNSTPLRYCERQPATQEGDTSLNENAADADVARGASDAPAPRERRAAVSVRGSQAFCAHPGYWPDRYADANGRLRGEICSDTYPDIFQSGGSESECSAAIDRLPELYAELADLRAERARELGAVRIEGRFGARRGRGGGLQSQFGNFMQTLSRMRGGQAMRGYPYPPGSPYYPMNYGAQGYGYPNQYGGYYGGAPGGIPNGGICNNGQNPMWQNPYLNSMMPPWANGMGPWGMPQGPQIRPLPGQGWPGQGWPNGLGGIGGRPQIRPIPFMQPGMPGMPGVPLGGGIGGQFGAPRTIPLAGGVNGGLPFAPGLNGMPTGVPSFIGGGYAPGTIPLGGTYAGQMGAMGGALGAWGAGAIPNSFYGGTSYVGPGYSYQPGYFNMPPVGGTGGGAPIKLPMGPF